MRATLTINACGTKAQNPILKTKWNKITIVINLKKKKVAIWYFCTTLHFTVYYSIYYTPSCNIHTEKYNKYGIKYIRNFTGDIIIWELHISIWKQNTEVTLLSQLLTAKGVNKIKTRDFKIFLNTIAFLLSCQQLGLSKISKKNSSHMSWVQLLFITWGM